MFVPNDLFAVQLAVLILGVTSDLTALEPLVVPSVEGTVSLHVLVCLE